MNMNSPVISHIKLAEMRSTTEGCNLVARLVATPGLVVKSSDVVETSLTESIDEGGGSVWWCGTCDILCSPKRRCSCDSPQEADDTKYILPLSRAELHHLMRALKFCRHSKSKLQLHVKDQEWIDSISSIIRRVEGSEE